MWEVNVYVVFLQNSQRTLYNISYLISIGGYLSY